MVTTKITLNKDLLSILLTAGFDNFTVLELRSAYLARVDDPALGKVEARRYVYRHILRLEKNGLLVKNKLIKKNRTYYSKTSAFSEDKFKTRSQPNTNRKLFIRSTDGFNHKLKEKLHLYRSELLISLGETEEYQSLHEEFPDLAKELQYRYDSARDHCSKIHGRIKAIESLINNTVSGSKNAIA